MNTFREEWYEEEQSSVLADKIIRKIKLKYKEKKNNNKKK
jgi:hypothetical protein